MSLFSIMRTDFADRRVSPGKCRSRGVESNSDPRSLPSRGRPEPPAAATSPGEEVTQVGATAPATAREALDMVRAGLGYLAAADAAQLPAATQAECLRELEQHDAIATAARAGFLAAFTAGQGHAGDGDYSAVSWLMHRTGITRGAAVGHTAWAKRAATHPRVLAALAAGQVSESAGRLICLWTGKLPQEYRDAADEQLLAAVRRRAGAGGPGGPVRRDVRPGPRGPARSGPGPGVRRPGGEAGHHDRRGRGPARRPDRRVRRRGGGGAGRAGGPGRERR